VVEALFFAFLNYVGVSTKPLPLLASIRFDQKNSFPHWATHGIGDLNNGGSSCAFSFAREKKTKRARESLNIVSKGAMERNQGADLPDELGCPSFAFATRGPWRARAPPAAAWWPLRRTIPCGARSRAATE
jgi:hypothetical protein